jgi:soluble lytic murein transglycosylase-like protein
MYAKSVHDRLQKLLRHAGTRARPLRASLVVLALFSLVALLVLPLRSAEPEADVAVSLHAAEAGQPSTNAAHGPAAQAEDSRYQALAEFLARKYKVSERVIFNIVTMAHHAGRQIGIDPLLIIAVMAVESRFNPIAESIAGAKGLMQVIPRFHTDKLSDFGGEASVFDPQTNILVGTQILKEYIVRTGSVNAALQMYAGALNDVEVSYTTKVMNEKQRLQQVVGPAAARPVVDKRPKRDPAADAAPI